LDLKTRAAKGYGSGRWIYFGLFILLVIMYFDLLKWLQRRVQQKDVSEQVLIGKLIYAWCA
jgi:hypothetical protein